jgi:hypothetical protein
VYAVIEKNRITISVAEFYNMAWYNKNHFGESNDKYVIDYGSLEVDVHRNGKRYLTGFVIDPRKFIVDYLWNQYKMRLPPPRKIEAVSIDSGTHVEILSVDFLKARSFVVDGMEKDLIFPQFCRRKGKVTIQGFEVLSIFSMIRYLARRFKYKGTRMIRQGETAYDLGTKRHWKIRLGEKRRKRRTLTG